MYYMLLDKNIENYIKLYRKLDKNIEKIIYYKGNYNKR